MIMRNRDIEAGANAVAEDFIFPGGGRKKIARLVQEHLDWFNAAEARGMSLDDIVAALTAAGATYEDGSRINPGTLSAALWRKRNKPREGVTPERAPNRQPQRLAGTNRRPAGRDADSPKPPSSKRVRMQSGQHGNDGGLNVGSRRHASSKKSLAKPSLRSKQGDASSPDVLAYMKSAARLRGHQD